MAISIYAIEECEDGRWMIIELRQQDALTHHRVLPDLYDTEGEAQAKADELSAGSGKRS